jgi:DNA-binding transcriptional LysR family regulator
MRAPQHLNALRAFEAVARHLSQVGAADELHATPATVGQLIRMLAVDRVDAGLRYGAGHWPDPDATFRLRDESFPVCSPARLAGAHPLRTPQDLTFMERDLAEGRLVRRFGDARGCRTRPANATVFH